MTSPSATAQESLLTRPDDAPRVYWHRELPPARAEIMGEHVLEATSERVQGSLAHRDEIVALAWTELATTPPLRT